jgi:WXG100 family type VII secretion target
VPTTQAEAAVMERTAARFEEVNGSLQAMLTRLMGQLEVLRGQWQGAGGRTFGQVARAWRQEQESLQRALLATAGAIRTAGRDYQATDTEAATRVARAGGAHLPLPL